MANQFKSSLHPNVSFPPSPFSANTSIWSQDVTTQATANIQRKYQKIFAPTTFVTMFRKRVSHHMHACRLNVAPVTLSTTCLENLRFPNALCGSCRSLGGDGRDLLHAYVCKRQPTIMFCMGQSLGIAFRKILMK